MAFKLIVTILIVLTVSCTKVPKRYSPSPGNRPLPDYPIVPNGERDTEEVQPKHQPRFSNEECNEICRKYVECVIYIRPIAQEADKLKIFANCIDEDNIDLVNVHSCHCSSDGTAPSPC